MNQVLETALQYQAKNLCVIPINPYTKKPFFGIEEFQKRYSTKEEIQKWWREFPTAMIGIMTGKISDLFVLDLDPGHDPSQIGEFISDSIITPTSITPRKGNHLYFKCPEDERVTIKAPLMKGVDYRCNGGYIIAPPSRNGYGRGYQWLDGLSLIDLAPEPLPQELYNYILKNLHYKSKGKKDGVTSSDISTQAYFQEGRRDEDLFTVANSLVKTKVEEGLVFQTLNIIGENCDPPFPKNEILEKIDSAFKRARKRERNLTEDIERWVSVTNGYFSVTDSDRALLIVTNEEKIARRQVFHRLLEKGIVERFGEKDGVYRRVESQADEIDFMGTEEKILNLQWPFEIERWVKILPKNIIVIAGESNAGKTAFLLNASWLNMGKFKINYFSSEMGAMELRARLQKFEGNLQHWKDNVNFRERSSNFADVVKPNDVNIIDFLEVTEDFFKVGGMIKEIYDKLKKGIAIIALQKNKGRDLGLGAERSIEKARLYLSIESGKIKIVKGKNWANPEINPNGMMWSFKLVQGSKFIVVDKPETRSWHDKEDR